LLKLSPYAIGIYEQCPRRYRYQYVERLISRYRKPWPWLTMGANVHAALTQFLSVVPSAERTADTIERLLRERWRASRQGFADRDEERRFGERAVAMLRWFADTQPVDVQPLMLERFHEAPVGERLVLRGRIDRVDRDPDGGLHVIDYKTGKVPEHPDTFQLLQYALILPRILGGPVSRASYLYLGGEEWRTMAIEPEIVDKTRLTVLSIAARIEREADWPTSVSRLCRYCDFLELCEDGGAEYAPADDEPEED
jgi:putative RecB family exonuclease